MIRLIVFGALGTLVDCLDLQRLALNSAFASHGVMIALEPAAYRVLHRPLGDRSVVERAIAASGETVPDPDAVVATFRQRLQVRLSGPLPLRPGLRTTFPWAGRQGVAIALLSSSAPGIVRRVLASTAEVRSGVTFDAITLAADGIAMRPAPDGYLDLLEQMGVPPRGAVAVEDLPEGVIAAQRAGVPVLGFPNPQQVDLDFGETRLVDAVTPDVLTGTDGPTLEAAE